MANKPYIFGTARSAEATTLKPDEAFDALHKFAVVRNRIFSHRERARTLLDCIISRAGDALGNVRCIVHLHAKFGEDRKAVAVAAERMQTKISKSCG